LIGEPAWRRGAAKIYAHNINDNKCRKVCLEGLLKLLNDSDEQVRRNTANVFGKLNEESFLESQQFILSYISQSVPIEDERRLTEFLWENGMLDPKWSLTAINSFLNHHSEKNTRSYHRSGEYLIRLVLRIYSDKSLPKKLMELSLDVFDELMNIYPGDTFRILDEWDRK
jgi:hypothetical protein